MNIRFPTVTLVLVLLQSGCATATPTATPTPTAAASPGQPELACQLPSNCVSSQGSGGLAPLAFSGTPAQAMVLLQATLKTFPEASIVRTEPLALEVIFTTLVGFRDQVDFIIDPQALRIDFRSRSLFGLYDFGKNRSRMNEFRTRFEQQTRQ